jgi:hypothetical protein
LYRNPETDKWIVTGKLANVKKGKGTIVSVGTTSAVTSKLANVKKGKGAIVSVGTSSAVTSKLANVEKGHGFIKIKWTVTGKLANVKKGKDFTTSVGMTSASNLPAKNGGFKIFSNGEWTADPTMTYSAVTSDSKKTDAAPAVQISSDGA